MNDASCSSVTYIPEFIIKGGKEGIFSYFTFSSFHKVQYSKTNLGFNLTFSYAENICFYEST